MLIYLGYWYFKLKWKTLLREIIRDNAIVCSFHFVDCDFDKPNKKSWVWFSKTKIISYSNIKQKKKTEVKVTSTDVFLFYLFIALWRWNFFQVEFFSKKNPGQLHEQSYDLEYDMRQISNHSQILKLSPLDPWFLDSDDSFLSTFLHSCLALDWVLISYAIFHVQGTYE